MRAVKPVGWFTVLIAVLIAGPAPAGEVVRTSRLVSEHVVDCHSVESIIAGIITPGMSQREKAEAVYEFVRNYRYHWAPAREGDRRGDFEYGVVYDPIKLLNVYGYGYCFQTAALLECLYQAAGLEARGCGITGHAICEVFYDGAYHYYDADQHGYFLLPDARTVASMDQLSRDPIRLVLRQPNPGDPFFPATANPLVPYESKVLLAGHVASRHNNYTRHDKIDQGHRMDITLVPGMRYIRRFQPRGQWNYRHDEVAGDCQVGYIDPIAGPKDYLSEKRYGNGSLLWQPDLTRATNEYRLGVWSDANIAQDDNGLTPARAGEPAWAVFRVRVPYAIVGWPTSWTGEPRPVGAAVVSASFARDDGDSQAISVSIDGGRSWTPVWTGEQAGASRAVVDLSEHVAARYEYMVRLEMTAAGKPEQCRLDRLAIRTSFQLNPDTLPALRDGPTRMTFTLGEQTETWELTADLSSPQNFLRDAESVRGVWLDGGQIRGRYGRTGEVIYKFEPPRPGVVRGVQAVAGCRREPGQLHHLDDVKIYYAENEPRNWKLIADDDVPPYARHWSSFLPGQARCSGQGRRVFVKFAIRTESNSAIRMLRVRAHWTPDEPSGESPLPLRGVRVEHCWTERDGGDAQRVEKRFETIVQDVPTDYVVEAGRDVVNRWVAIEPVRDPRIAWRRADPPVRRPDVPPVELVDPAVRDEMRSLLRAIDADPESALPKAAASRSPWLADAARQAQAMFQTDYPLLDQPRFGEATLAQAARLTGLADPPTPADADTLLAALQSTRDDADRATLAAALVLAGDSRGVGPLAEALSGVPPVLALEPAAVLLRAGEPTGRQTAASILAGPDTYLKLRYLEHVGSAELEAMPDELLVGLRDPSRWVRLAVLGLIRGSGTATPAARAALTRMARGEPLLFLRAEAVSVLNAVEQTRQKPQEKSRKPEG